MKASKGFYRHKRRGKSHVFTIVCVCACARDSFSAESKRISWLLSFMNPLFIRIILSVLYQKHRHSSDMQLKYYELRNCFRSIVDAHS